MELPFVLAGPILRRVEPRAVAVWVALSRPATVALSLWEGLRQSGTAARAIAVAAPVSALRVGERLYIALAVVRIASPAVPLQPGVNYAYDLALKRVDETRTRSLASEGLLGRFAAAGLAATDWASDEPLGYGVGFLPSFALPPAQLTDVRIVYGSCRRPANAHFDAMPWIDTLVNEAFSGQTRAEGAPLGTAALRRPHQLYLGGDQIYADDVSPLHLTLSNRLAHALIGGSETPAAPKVELLKASGQRLSATTTFPESLLIGRASVQNGDQLVLAPVDYPATLTAFPAGGRYELTLADARFTSVDGESHLLSFGEFAAMYVSVYADWFWSGLKDLGIDAVAKAPGTIAPEQPAPMYSRSLLDSKVVEYFGAGRWIAWNDIRPGKPGRPDKKKFDQCFASFMVARLSRPDLPTGFDGFRALTGDPDYLKTLDPALREELDPDVAASMENLASKHAAVFRTFMGQLQGRVMRGLVKRFGITRLTDVDCSFDPDDEDVQAQGLSGRVLLHGPTAISAELHKREKLYEKGTEDRWCAHLNTLLDGPPALDWKAFVRECLATPEARPWIAPEVPTLVPKVKPPPPEDIADAPLDTALLNQLVAGWTNEPVAGKHKEILEAEYTDLSRTMLARCVAALAKEIWSVYRSLHGHLHDLRRFALGQPKVRRALANVPTYMIFDDHDVTDDWNLNPEWCKRVFAADATRTQPLGRQIVRNALASYALFQDWGNDLTRYASGTPGAQVLAQVGRLFPANPTATTTWPQKAATDALDKLFGLDKLPQPVDTTRPHGRHAAIDAPMKWHFTVGGPQFLVAVLDNRTRRGFATKFGPPGNVGTTMIDDQVPAAPLPAGKEVLLVVAPLQVLAPSVFDEIVAPGAYRAFDLGVPKKIGAGRGGEAMPGLNPDAIESWALDAITFEALTARLAPHRKVVLLSGDVHNSTATQMSYWRKGVAEPSRILQFTSSGLKNVMPSYLTLIDHSLAFAQELIRADFGGDRLGWLAGAEAAFSFAPGKGLPDVPVVLRKRVKERPAFLPVYGWPAGTSVRADQRPDFSWTLRPIFDVRPDSDAVPPGVTPRPLLARPVPFSGTPPTRAQLAAKGASALAAYAQVANRHFRQLDRLSHSRQILFRSNLGQVVFQRRGAVLEAVHQVITVLPDPLDRAEQPHLLKPEVVMEQRGELTPPANAVRPEDLALKGPLGESLFDKLRALG